MLISALLVSFISFAQESNAKANETIQARARIIIDNDFRGDPDDLFQLAHHLLSLSVEIRGVMRVCQKSELNNFFLVFLGSLSETDFKYSILRGLILLLTHPLLWLSRKCGIVGKAFCTC